MTTVRLRFVAVCMVLCLVLSSVTRAQTASIADTTSLSSFRAPLFGGDAFQHRAGAGLSVGISEINYGRQVFFFWTFYQYRFSPLFALEASANVHQAASSYEDFTYRTVFVNPRFIQVIPIHSSSNRASHAATVSITGVFSPFDDKRFQLGAGVSVRSAGLLAGTIITRLDTLSQTIDRTDTQQYALGANVHGEYLLPLGGNIDIGFRVHVHGFLPPFAFIRERKPIGFISGRGIAPDRIETFPPMFYGVNGGIGAVIRVGL